MKPLYLFLIFILLTPFALFSQTQLSDSKRNSTNLYIYQISNDNLRKIYLKDQDPNEEMLQSFITSYARGTEKPELPRGNYIIAGAEGGHFVFNSHTVDDLNFKVISSEQMMLCLYDSLGNIIKDAIVKCGNANLKFDKKTQTYNAKSVKNEQVIEINNKGVLHYIEFEKNTPQHQKGNIFKQNRNKIKYTWYRVKQNVRWIFNPEERPEKNKYTGFIVFSKPKYKPGETVKLKAYMAEHNGKPYDKPVNIWLNHWLQKADTILVKQLKPYRPGMYEFQFKLSDSLNLKLDTDYDISLLANNLNDNSINESFRYEDYELKSTQFSISTNKKLYAKHDSIKIKLKATDENEMAMYGGKVEVLVTPVFNTKKATEQGVFFIPDTLWKETIEMNDISEKEIIIPDSIFPSNLSIDYNVRCIYLSADNEKVEKSERLSRESQDFIIDFSLDKGVLTIKELYKGESQKSDATITVSGENDEELLSKTVTLPYSMPIPWTASDVFVKTKNTTDIYLFEGASGNQLGYKFYRQNDSIILQVENPANIPFWYVVREKNANIANGYTSELDYAAKDNGKDGYSMQLSYIFGGKSRSINASLPFLQKNMAIDVSTPTVVYPGQKATVIVSATDKNGKPVENADITAYAFTSKFQTRTVPNLQIQGTVRNPKQFSNIHYQPEEDGIYNRASLLEWDKWKNKMSLDTIEYYKFLYPDISYSYAEPTADGSTQIAPYIVINGLLQEVQMLWIDERLFYAKQAQQPDIYTFKVEHGKHSLRFRTYDREISIYNVFVEYGVKNIMSFDVSKPYSQTFPYNDETIPFIISSKLLKKQEHGVFSDSEMELLSSQLITIDNNFDKLQLPNIRRIIEYPAYVNSGGIYYHLNHSPKTYYNQTLRGTVNMPTIIGPFPYRNVMNGVTNIASVFSDNQLLCNFEIEGGNNYTFYKDYQKIKTWKNIPFTKHFKRFSPSPDFKAGLLTKEDIDEHFKKQLAEALIAGYGFAEIRGTNLENKTNPYNLVIDLKQEDNTSPITPALIFITPQNKDNILNYRLYYGGVRDFRNLPEGDVTISLIFKDTTSYSQTISLQKKGQNYLKLDSIGRDENQKTAKTAFNLLQRGLYNIYTQNPYSTKEPQQDSVIIVAPQKLGEYKERNATKGVVTGTVLDEFRESIIGAVVSIEGSPARGITDFDGNFEINAKKGDKINISYLGYKTTTVNYSEGYHYNIVLKEDAYMLQEVVVVGYGTQKKSFLTGSVAKISNSSGWLNAELSGVVPGLMIRGTSSPSAGENQLILIDGLPYDGKIEDLDPSTIISLNVLKDSNLTSIYGSKAANGVVMIQTNKLGATQQKEGEDGEETASVPGNSMRRNFHDDAFWQPSLKTDSKGKASFEVTYPDDITSWDAYFIAVGNRKQSDKKQMTIKSFKAISARLSTPRFAIRGDSLNAVGRIANLVNDTIQVSRTINIQGQKHQENIKMTASYTDQIPVSATTGDSLTIAYSLQLPNGYFDGEERSLPILEQGMIETHGEFKVLNDSTTTIFNVNPVLGTTTLHAEASSLEIFLREIDKIDKYPYLCNEQMASKIKALVAKKRLAEMFGKPFKEDKKVKELIGRLNKNRNQENMWGWWNNDKTEFWVSRQVIDALLDAEESGYKIEINKIELQLKVEKEIKSGLEALQLAIPGRLPFAKQELLERLILLKRMNAPIDYKSYYTQINQLLKDWRKSDKLKEMLLLSMIGLKDQIEIDTLMHYSQKTMLGSIYWGEIQRYQYNMSILPYENNTENTLIAYKILRNLNVDKDTLSKVRNYFFECRNSGYWQNTYESSRIIETIMPDMLDKNTTYSEVTMSINGQKVSKFPYTEKIKTTDPIRIKKEGTLPLFITAYQQEWNPDPQKESAKGFSIHSFFMENRDTVANLKAGKSVKLEIKVKVDASAEYIQIEIPIPAGCSYDSKSKNYFWNEVHREYFKEKVSIFCNKLNKGEYTFTIDLIPRYTGKYTLNPAKIELMYFPTFYGNENKKTIFIEN